LSRIRPPLIIKSDTFLFRIRQEAGLPQGVEPETVIKAVFSATKDELSEERVQEIAGFLPDKILELWQQAIFGSLLVGISAIPLSSQAIPVPNVNACLSLSPEALANQGRANIARENCTVVAQATPPLPEELQPPSATVVLVNGTVNVTIGKPNVYRHHLSSRW
jgi:hypothetical protein